MKQLRHGFSAAGVHGLRRDLVERDQHEGPLGEPRMRNLETCLTEAEVTQHQDIQIKCTRAIGDASGAVAAEIALDSQQRVEQGDAARA